MTKFSNVKKRFLSAFLALVLAFGMMPFQSITAYAETKTYDLYNGFKVTLSDVHCVKHDNSTDHPIKRIKVNACEYNKNARKTYVGFYIYYDCNGSEYSDLVATHFSGDCTKPINVSDTYSTGGSSNRRTVDYTITRTASEHNCETSTTPANCASPAKTNYKQCIICGITPKATTSGSTNPNNHTSLSSWTNNGDGTHSRTCSGCEFSETASCAGGTANCTNKAVCSTCKSEYGTINANNHGWGDWISNGNGTHTRTCSYNSNHKESGTCSGGTASCTDKAVCSICKTKYGTEKGHSYEYTVNGNVITETCKNNCGHRETATLKLDGSISLVYNGSAIKPLTVEYSDGWAGDKTAKIIYADDCTDVGNYSGSIEIGGLTATQDFSISQAQNSWNTEPSISGWTYGESANTPNNGSPKFGSVTKVEYKSVSANDSEYSTTVPTNAGSYNVRFTVEGNANYTSLTKEIKFEIEKAKITVAIDGKTSIYGNDIVTLTATDNGIVNGDTNVYRLSTTASKTASVGTYDITGTAIDDNYIITFIGGEKAYEITKRNLTITVVVNNKQYDGLNTASIKSATLNNVANGDSITLVNGTPTFNSVDVADGIGIAFTEFKLSGDADVLKNYTLTQPTGITANITNGWNPAKDTEYITSTPNTNGWLKEDFIVSAKGGYELSLTNSAGGTWENILIGAVESADSSLTFYVRNKITGAISEQVTVNYKLDKNSETTGTTGRVEFVGRTGWQTFVKNITFSLFYKDEVTVKAEANDGLSGVASLEYAVSDKAMSLEEVKAITDWKAMPKDGVGVTLEDEKTFVYFIRITDKAGNVTYLSTDGAEYDTTLPAIEGIENGGVYHTTQVITVTDKNLESVTLNSEPVTLGSDGKLTLIGNLDTTYIITVTDKAGNITDYTVTMKVIADITDSIKDITVDEVTSDDKENIETVIKNIEEELKNEDLTDEEKAELEDEKQKAEDLIKKIEEAIGSTKTENTDKVKDTTADNVKTEDKKDLESAKADLEKTLEDYKDNLTDDEKKEIEKEIERIEDALQVIEKVEYVEDLIGKLPDTITKGDADAVKKADEAYNALSEYEKSILSEDAKQKLDNAKATVDALNKNTSTKSPATGNDGFTALWLAVLIASGGVLLLIPIDRKKKVQSNN